MEARLGRPAQVFEGQKRHSRIYHCGDGFYYNERERRRHCIRLLCRYRKSRGQGCPGTASISRANGLLKHLAPHNHLPDQLLREDFALRRAMIQEAKRDVHGKKIRSVLDEMKLSVRNPELAKRFTRVRMTSALYAARSENYPPIPSSLLYLGVLLGTPELRALCKTYDGADYIFQGVVGCEQSQTVALLFVSGRMLQFLQTRESIHADSTFRKRPKKPKVMQIFNIVAKHGDNVIGVLRVLMMRRTEAAYVEVFNFLKLIAPRFQPRRVHCDFEKPQMLAFRLCFPLCKVVGCLWHYSVCVSKYARRLGLAPLADQNKLVFSFISCLCAVPLLPRHLLWHGVLEIWEEVRLSGWSDALRPLFEYFEAEWRPRFDELSVFNEADRTNNCSETDNRMLANAIPTNYPNIWFMLGGFVKLEYLSWCDKIAIDELRAVAPGRRFSSLANDRKVRLASQLLVNRHISPGHFLHQTSAAIHAGTMYGLQLHDDSDSEDSTSDSDSD